MKPINVIPFSGDAKERERFLFESGFYSTDFMETRKVMDEFVSDMNLEPKAALLFYDCHSPESVNDATMKYQELNRQYNGIPIVLVGTSEETSYHYPMVHQSVTDAAERLFEQIQKTNPCAHYQVSLSSEYGHAVDMKKTMTRDELLSRGPGLSAPLAELKNLIAGHYTQ